MGLRKRLLTQCLGFRPLLGPPRVCHSCGTPGIRDQARLRCLDLGLSGSFTFYLDTFGWQLLLTLGVLGLLSFALTLGLQQSRRADLPCILLPVLVLLRKQHPYHNQQARPVMPKRTQLTTGLISSSASPRRMFGKAVAGAQCSSCFCIIIDSQNFTLCNLTVLWTT